MNDSKATSPPTIAWIKYSPGSTFRLRPILVLDGLGQSAGIVIGVSKIRLPSAAVHAIKNTSCSYYDNHYHDSLNSFVIQYPNLKNLFPEFLILSAICLSF